MLSVIYLLRILFLLGDHELGGKGVEDRTNPRKGSPQIAMHSHRRMQQERAS